MEDVHHLWLAPIVKMDLHYQEEFVFVIYLMPLLQMDKIVFQLVKQDTITIKMDNVLNALMDAVLVLVQLQLNVLAVLNQHSKFNQDYVHVLVPQFNY